jgi:hypothetical protein
MAQVIQGPSERSFGFTFAVVFLLVGLGPWIVHGHPIYLWALVLAGLFAAAAIVAPRVLSPLNRVWFRLGILLHHVGNPVVMGLIYILGFVPLGLAIRARGKDLLRLKWDPDAPSYWIRRRPPGPSPASMSKQF